MKATIVSSLLVAASLFVSSLASASEWVQCQVRVKLVDFYSPTTFHTGASDYVRSVRAEVVKSTRQDGFPNVACPKVGWMYEIAMHSHSESWLKALSKDRTYLLRYLYLDGETETNAIYVEQAFQLLPYNN